jgi:hypothetical protein
MRLPVHAHPVLQSARGSLLLLSVSIPAMSSASVVLGLPAAAEAAAMHESL